LCLLTRLPILLSLYLYRKRNSAATIDGANGLASAQ
jgi:hypothetical protein